MTTDLARLFIDELKSLYPQFKFISSIRFKYRPPKSIYVVYGEDNFALQTLHELGHALCKHENYQTLVERLKIESEAWERAKQVVSLHPEWLKKYQIKYDSDFAESQLDTYRDWLHAKTLCPNCGLTRYQTPNGRFHCPHCDP